MANRPRPAGIRGPADYSAVFSALLHSTPVWIRGFLLMVVAGMGISITIVFSIAVFSGRGVELWPPKVTAFEPPEVQNCRQAISALPTLQSNVNLQAERLGTLMSQQFADANAMQKEYVRQSSSIGNYGRSEAEASAKLLYTKAEATRDQLFSVLKANTEEIAKVRSACLK